MYNSKFANKSEIHRDFAARVFKEECPLCFASLGNGICKECGAAFVREKDKIFHMEDSCNQYDRRSTKIRMMRKRKI